MMFTTALNLTFSPGEKEQHSHISDFADDRPANPVARIFRKPADDSPSPGGEGRGEDGLLNKFLFWWNSDLPARCTGLTQPPPGCFWVEQASRLLNLASRQISWGDVACGLAVVETIIVVANGFRRDAGNNRPEACATKNRVPLRVKLARAIKTTGISMFVRAAAGLRDTAALRLCRDAAGVIFS